MREDLHLHTNFSNCAEKSNSFESLLKLAELSRLDRISITDHNTCVAHVLAALRDISGYYRGELVPGMECDVAEDGVTFELLAYDFNVMPIFGWANAVYSTPEVRQTKIKNKLLEIAHEKGFALDETMSFDGTTTYAHKYVYDNLQKFKENNHLFEKYKINSLHDFYRLSTTAKDFPLYIDMGQFFPNVREVADAIHSAGGVVVLAHPYNYPQSVDVENLLSIVLRKDERGKNIVDGIEVYHPSASEEQIEFLINFAKQHNLMITGGSDYHGKGGKEFLAGVESQELSL